VYPRPLPWSIKGKAGHPNGGTSHYNPRHRKTF
jgi:hypothetical protein